MVAKTIDADEALPTPSLNSSDFDLQDTPINTTRLTWPCKMEWSNVRHVYGLPTIVTNFDLHNTSVSTTRSLINAWSGEI